MAPQLTALGLFNYLGKLKAAGTLSDLAGPYGIIDCAFICCDLPYSYVDEYFDKLGETAFHPIRNQVRLFCPFLFRANY